MITRLYVNNFRCLVAFEARFDSFGVLCGPNGVGKSSVFDAMRVLRDLAAAEITVDQAVSYNDHTNWLDSKVVEFEVDLKSEGHTFMYRLHIEQVSESVKPRIVHEQASCDGEWLFERNLDGVKFEKKKFGAATGFHLRELAARTCPSLQSHWSGGKGHFMTAHFCTQSARFPDTGHSTST